LGRLYKGDPKTDAKRPGQERPHFRFEPEAHPVLTADRLSAAWRDLYGNEPTVIRNVQFASDALHQVFDEHMEDWARSAKGTPVINRRCDGLTCYLQRVADGVNRQPQPCICAATNNPVCKQTGRLLLFLPELCAHLGALGLVMLITHSTTDLDNIRGTLELMSGSLGRLRNMAFVLYRKETQLTTPSGAPVKKWIVYLEADEKAAQAAALAAGDMLALPAPDEGYDAPPAAQAALSATSGRPNDPTPAPDVIDAPEAVTSVSEPSRVGVASQVVVKASGNKRAYALRIDHNGAAVQLSSTDALKGISPAWAAHVKAWEGLAAGLHPIQPVTVWRDDQGLFFEAEDPRMEGGL
jgi:hypothetical protein